MTHPTATPANGAGPQALRPAAHGKVGGLRPLGRAEPSRAEPAPRVREAPGSARELTSSRRRPAGSPFSAFPSSVTSRRVRGRHVRGRALCLLATALALLGAGAAQAQTSVKLVGNTGQSQDATSALTVDRAQQFTTGSETTGYVLTSVAVAISGTVTASTSIAMRIESSTASDEPGGSVGGGLTFGSATSSMVTFTSSGIALEPETTYFVVWESDSAESVLYRRTDSDAEDSGAEAGWSIADGSLWKAQTSDPWGASTSSLQLDIHGYAKPIPAPKLVSNTGETDGGDGALDHDHLQSFSTGRHPSGYKLTSVALELHVASGTAPTYTVKVTDTNSIGIGTLTQQSNLTGSATVVQFTAADDGLDLDPDTVYGVFLDVTAGANANAHIGRTTSKAQDSGGAAGFRIGNSRQAKPSGDTTFPGTPVTANVLKLAVHGHPKPLVSNTGQNSGTWLAFDTGTIYADGFTTGSYGGGYTLTGVDLKLDVRAPTGTTEPEYTVSVWSSGSDGNPEENLGTLTNPDALTGGEAINSFTAATGIDLDANTTYFVVLETTSVGDRDPRQLFASADDEDAGAAPGWSIADAVRFSTDGGSTWTVAGTGISDQFAIRADHNPPLVGNTGRDDGGGGSLANDHAQAFSTGGVTAGYKLTGVDLQLALTSGTTAPTYSVSVRSSTASNEPDETTGGAIGLLTQQGTLTAGAGLKFFEFTASGDGLDLDANTTYWLLFDVTADATANATIRRVAGTGEDPDSASGWSIADSRLFRAANTTAWNTESTSSPVLKLAVVGRNKAPANSAPEIERNIDLITVRAGASRTLNLAPFFSDPEGDALTYAATSSNTAAATVSVVGATLTVRGVAQGSSTVTVTATDPGGSSESAKQTFAVTVRSADDRPPTPPTPPPSGGGPGDGGGGGGGTEPRNAAPEASGTVGALTLGAGGSVGVDLSARFTDPDGDELDFAAESSNPAVAAVSVDGETLTVTGIAPGAAEVTATATDPDGASATQSFTVTVTGVERVWHLPPASDPVLQGFVRVINHSDHAGEATVTATDDAGRAYDPLTLALARRGAAHFNVHDLEMGNPAKGLTGATGPGAGGWRLAVESESLAVEALAYARAADGFLTPLDGAAPRAADGALALATFNPGSNWRQVGLLRLANPTTEDAEAAVAGTDDAGSSPSAPVRLTIPAGTACTVDAAELESGSGLACGAPQAGLGDGEGKWRLRIESGAPLVAMGLLRSPTGHLSNLSAGALPAGAGGVRRVHMFPSASDPDGRQGFVRFINRSDRDGTVTVRASDGTDADYEALTLALPAGQAAQLNSDDLELGNPDKGLTGSTGPGRGDWTLALSAEGIEFDAYAYVRSPDGFLAPMGAAAPSRDVDGSEVHRVAFLNPGGNWRQRSVLRLVNPGGMDADVSVEGTDDAGLRPGSPVRVAVPAGGSVELASAELESGDAQSIETGALGDGGGKWRLRIESDRPVAALSLATSPTGRLVNLSGADADRGFRHGLLPPPGGVTLESPYECELLGRWDAARGDPHAVDLLRDGERLAAHSAERWTHPTRRWAGLCGGGDYRIRVCALNADGDCGPWSAESNPVTVD